MYSEHIANPLTEDQMFHPREKAVGFEAFSAVVAGTLYAYFKAAPSQYDGELRKLEHYCKTMEIDFPPAQSDMTIYDALIYSR